jgi:hypothetical protein
MKRLIASLIMVAALAAPAAANQDVTFETVDEVSRGFFAGGLELQIGGVPQGQSEPFLLHAFVESFGGVLEDLATNCERMALLAMSRPGRYLLRITTIGGGG